MPTNRKPNGKKPQRNASRPSVKANARRKPAVARPALRDQEAPVEQPQDSETERHSPRQADRRAQLQSKSRPSLNKAEEERFESVTLDVEGKRITLTRRHFLYGALGAGAAAIMASGAVLTDEGKSQGAYGIDVPENAVMQIEDLEEVGRDASFLMLTEHSLPFGTLVWTNSDDIACCLTPTDQASPLTQVSVLMNLTGVRSVVLEGAVGQSEGYEVVDARASLNGLIWIEASAMESKWRVLCAPLSDALTLGDARVLDEGDSSTEIPSIAAVADCAWWQTMPPASDEEASEKQSELKRANFSKGDAVCVHSASGRMACPVCPCADGVAIAAHDPRHQRTYNLLKFTNSSTDPQDRLALPSGMTPSAIGWGECGFSFCFEGIYDYGGGISNLGSYTPIQPHKPNTTYDGLQWFRFGRTPTTGPYWCGSDWFMVKSTMSICGVNPLQGTYCTFDVDSGCTDWGDHLCSTGCGGVVVTASQKGSADDGETVVRVWEPVAIANVGA